MGRQDAKRERAVRPAIDAFNRTFTRFHTWTYVKSRGWLGHRWTLVPSLILHTTGRSSGLRRSVVLVYAADADKLLVVASNFGQDRPPAWLLNLQAEPRAEVNVGRKRMTVEAEIVAPNDPEYPGLFQIVNENNRRRYDRYVALTDRPISIVVLLPIRVLGHRT